MSTEGELTVWRKGQIIAERLCADLLPIEGYKDIDPQSPLGGPDGKKDIICYRDGVRFVAACFFPPTLQEYNQIKTKYLDDLLGVKRNSAEGFIFFTNQRITPFQRPELVTLATESGAKNTEIYHVERIRSILDSPKGYGIRLQYLEIQLTKEEQISFFDHISRGVVQEVRELSNRFNEFSARTTAEFTDLKKTASSVNCPLPELPHFATASLTLEQICWIHRIVTDNSGLPPEQQGALRFVQVWVEHNDFSWVSDEHSTKEEIHLMGPSPKEIYNLVNSLLHDWRSNYRKLLNSSDEVRIEAIADFHHKLLAIHPFLDGNGRLARAILQQQIMELLNRRLSANFTEEPMKYIRCLMSADNGDLNPLILLIKANLE